MDQAKPEAILELYEVSSNEPANARLLLLRNDVVTSEGRVGPDILESMVRRSGGLGGRALFEFARCWTNAYVAFREVPV